MTTSPVFNCAIDFSGPTTFSAFVTVGVFSIIALVLAPSISIFGVIIAGGLMYDYPVGLPELIVTLGYVACPNLS